jgi:hypothetical protein
MVDCDGEGGVIEALDRDYSRQPSAFRFHQLQSDSRVPNHFFILPTSMSEKTWCVVSCEVKNP